MNKNTLYDKFKKVIMVGDYILYPDNHYAEIKVGLITKITEKTFKYKYFNNIYKRYEISTANIYHIKECVIINEIIPQHIKEELFNAS